MDCKVFVGNIPLKADMEELKKLFEVHGKIVGMNMKNMKGFTFIHFESADTVKKVIDAEHGREFCGANLNVKQAMKKEDMPAKDLTSRVMTADNVVGEKPKTEGEKKDSKEWSGGGGGGGEGGFPKHQPPPQTRGYQSGPPPTNQPPPHMGNMRPHGPPRQHAPPYSHHQGPPHQRHQGPPPARHQGPPPSHYQGPPRHQGPPPRQQGPPPRHQGPPPGHHGPPSGHHGASQERGLPPAPANQTPNDVEIICVMKNTRNWAEFIEGRLKNMGLRVDVLFPNPDISLGKVLGNIAMRGVMFAVCVAPDNERHRSLTVNVLQGEQQEHRNMPLDEAISFISRRYATFVEKGGPDKVGVKEEEPKVVTSGSLVTAEKVSFGGSKPALASSRIPANTSLPKEVVNIIGFLMDDRAMSIMEYDRLIKFLVSRREATLKEEYGSNIPAHLLVPPVGPNQDPALKSTQEELQNRIIEILNKKQNLLKSQQQQQQQPDSSSVGLGATDTGPGTQGGSEVGAAPAPAIAPSLQQAIDSLVKTGPNLLASLTGGSYGLPATNNSSGSSGAGVLLGDHLPEGSGGTGGVAGGGQLDRFYASMMDS